MVTADANIARGSNLGIVPVVLTLFSHRSVRDIWVRNAWTPLSKFSAHRSQSGGGRKALFSDRAQGHSLYNGIPKEVQSRCSYGSGMGRYSEILTKTIKPFQALCERQIKKFNGREPFELPSGSMAVTEDYHLDFCNADCLTRLQINLRLSLLPASRRYGREVGGPLRHDQKR
jgi:hypothetical protein